MTFLRVPLLCAALSLAACRTELPFPGDQLLGTFGFTAVRSTQGSNCDYDELGPAAGAQFEFSATLSRLRETGQSWVTAKEVVREAGFDGQFLETASTGARRFARCVCTGVEVQVRESFRVALLSRAQDRAAGGKCPPLTAIPFDADAGVLPPQSTPGGFDAQRACGELVDELVPNIPEGVSCPNCRSCTERYDLTGVRQ